MANSAVDNLCAQWHVAFVVLAKTQTSVSSLQEKHVFVTVIAVTVKGHHFLHACNSGRVLAVDLPVHLLHQTAHGTLEAGDVPPVSFKLEKLRYSDSGLI